MADEVSNVNGGSSTNDSIPVIVQQADVTSRSESVIGSENIAVTTTQTGNMGRNIRPRVGNFVPPVRFGSINGENNFQNPQQHSEYSRDYNVGSTSNAANSMAVYRQQVEENHHDLVNLLTQQMTTILNPMMADHESKFERLARQVEQISRIVDYEKGFYMRRKLLNVHIPDLAHLAEKVCQTELMKKEKEKYRSDQRSKSKPFTRKEKVAYVTMESSEEELDFEAKVDLDELKKGSPYVFSLLKKLPNNENSNESKLKSGKKDLIQEAIMEGRLKFDDGKKEMKVNTDLFNADASFVEPCFGVNMVGMSYDFDVALDDFESQVRSVYPRAGDGLLDFLVCNGFRTAKSSRRGMLFTAATHSGDIRDLPEPNIPTFVVKLEETCLKGISSPARMEKGKAVAQSSGVDKGKEIDVDEEYFEEGDDDMIGMISIIPTEYLGEYEGDPDEDYDMEDEKAFSFIRIEDESGYFLRPTEKQMSHLRPLHITTTLSGIKVNKVIIDGGAAISLLPERMLMKVGKHPDDLVPTNIAVDTCPQKVFR
ncbi:hypothetical protein Ahy_B01g052542 [Arachis hypogaea]|uniref:Aspartic peptidase DDI1-type domain-containing protein n=1 Tax=Arachis hypogaea TaxID=3818 RepID=A0A445APS5_ARAHY|nr:hypothetical protein Ahy_B01g052542 [Arachis hypogaea]